jgi:uncharacterized protein
MNRESKKIKSWSLLDSSRENKYFFDRELKRLQLCHPLLYHILKLYAEGADIGNWLDGLADDPGPVELDNIGRFSKKEIEYYVQKFFFLKENGYFTEFDQTQRLSGEINAQTIKTNLANTRQVLFEVTSRCDFGCHYCWFGEFYSHGCKRQNNDMDPGAAKNLLHYLVEHWNSPLNHSHDSVIHITFYGGEPLLNFSFIEEMVDYVKQLELIHNRFVFSMTTNGVHLRKYMDFLYEHNFQLLVSLDGDEQNNSYRVFKNGKPTFPAIMENVEALRKKYPGYFSGGVDFVAILHNKNSVPGVHRFFKEHFDKTPYIGPLNPTGVKESRKKHFWKTYANFNQGLYESEDYSLIEKDMFIKLPKVQDATVFLHRYNDFCYDNYNDLIYAAGSKRTTPTGTCTPFSKKIFLTVDGKILPCERIGQQFGLGLASPGRVELDCEKIAARYNDYYNKMRQQCNNCHNSDICTQCIFNIPGIENDKPECGGFMTETDFARYISAFAGYFEDQPGNFSRILQEAVV